MAFYKATTEERRSWYLKRLRKAIEERYEDPYIAPFKGAYKEYDILSAREAKTRMGKLSPNIKEMAYQRQKGKCGVCFNVLDSKPVFDHIYPISLIDKRSIHADKNVQLVHKNCNIQKAGKHPITFMQSLGYLL